MLTKQKVHESKTKLRNSSIYFIKKKQYRILTNCLFLHCTSVQYTSAGIFGLVYNIGLTYNAMSKSKSTVPSMVSCSFVYHSRRHRQCALKTLALSPLATKIGQLISQQQTYVHLL